MTVDSADLLALARELRGSPEEVRRRASTSRLYYGLLHRAIECLRDRAVGERPRGGSTYQWVRARLLEQSGDNMYVADSLRLLKQQRERADYDIDRYEGWSVERAEALALDVARLLDEYVVPAGSQPALGLIEPAS